MRHLKNAYTFYKQLGSGPGSQSCWYFQDFQYSKLLDGCVLVGQNNKF